jgi:hypothetical protein
MLDLHDLLRNPFATTLTVKDGRLMPRRRARLSIDDLEERSVPAQLSIFSPLDPGTPTAGTLRAAVQQAEPGLVRGEDRPSAVRVVTRRKIKECGRGPKGQLFALFRVGFARSGAIQSSPSGPDSSAAWHALSRRKPERREILENP